MPIRINLLSEALAAEQLRRSDPVKRAIFAGAFLVALSLVWFSSVWLTFVVEKQKLNQVDAEIQEHTNEYAQVQNNWKKIADLSARTNSLAQLAAARFLQGNLLNALQQTYVTNVLLNHLHVDQRCTSVPGTPAKTNSFGVIPARPPAVTEHVVLALDARDFSINPGDQVEHFKNTLLQQEYFNERLLTNGIRLSSLSALQTPMDSKPYIMFSLECRFADRNP
jgi:hypothetical protein